MDALVTMLIVAGSIIAVLAILGRLLIWWRTCPGDGSVANSEVCGPHSVPHTDTSSGQIDEAADGHASESAEVTQALPHEAAKRSDGDNTSDAAAEGDDRDLGDPVSILQEPAGERPADILPYAPERDNTPEAEAQAVPTALPAPPSEPARLAAKEQEAEPSESGADPAHSNGQPSNPLDRRGLRTRQLAVHRDRRGKRRRTSTPKPEPESVASSSSEVLPTPAELWLRLALHPIRRTAALSLVLSRPDGFPGKATILLGGEIEVGAYDQSRYDDIDVAWNADLLAGELRVSSTDGLQWLRSARRIHIFACDAAEPDLVSVSAVRVDLDHAIICRSGDVPSVRAIARSTGSPELTSHEHWRGIPAGWSVLSGYVPVRAAETTCDIAFRPLDPGVNREIILAGGLGIRPRVFAEGHAPRIEIRPAPEIASVTIAGQPASLNGGGAWEAAGWNVPGRHTVDVVPGPSLTYEIAADPANGAGWSFWDAHEQRFSGTAPWARARICGAMARGPAGEIVLAEETQPTMIALGASRGAIALQQRVDVGVSVALLFEPPAFLFASSGQRRRQGRVIWLGFTGTTPSIPSIRGSDLAWARIIRTAVSRRLSLEKADSLGKNVWRKAVIVARKLRRQRR